ncbi:thioredoxin-like protein 4B isoform X1 [Equus przewalskii]|uniref:Thioredoxin like 4B n=2 Tax=Equus TaxID=9789 RepID=A0A9L0TJU2_HORSE|nr:thioredoxin-like protein 4B isoform X1 [Equus caballus]XP_008519528.1 PREDICTED: thioredoxin-like protein 4B isoform X1 [Equus przewalskii]XP_008519529.1 PREDICTED: thioredoxin-like protein 4B isoform X1 [Equus przewalskii]XP_023493020.1 thioredoxin-like protein 4B isoform X1 [Equus caballus]
MSFLLPKLTSKKEVDQAIKSTAEKVLVLRFGRDEDPVCLQLDDILSKTSSDLSKMAAIYLVDVDQTPVYTHYFDISYIPSTVFFFNGQHMKVDYGHLAHALLSKLKREARLEAIPESSCAVFLESFGSVLRVPAEQRFDLYGKRWPPSGRTGQHCDAWVPTCLLPADLRAVGQPCSVSPV